MMAGLRRLASNRIALAGGVITLLVLLAIALGPSALPYDPDSVDFADILSPPSYAHLFGTDSFGRDVLTRVLYGGRISITISVGGMMLAAILGTAAGMTAAVKGGLVEVGPHALRGSVVHLSELRVSTVSDGGDGLRRAQCRPSDRADLLPDLRPIGAQHDAGRARRKLRPCRPADRRANLDDSMARDIAQHQRAARRAI